MKIESALLFLAFVPYSVSSYASTKCPTTPILVFVIFASYSVEIAQIRRSPGSRKGTASPYIYLMPVQQVPSGGISWGRYKIQTCVADSHISASILKS